MQLVTIPLATKTLKVDWTDMVKVDSITTQNGEVGSVSTIDLIDIARAGAFGPICIDAGLFDFASQLGVPNDWGGTSGNPMSCVMRFGCVEVGMHVVGGDLRVNYAKIHLSDFEKGMIAFGKSKDGQVLQITNPFTEKFPRFEEVSERLKREGLMFTNDTRSPVKDGTAAVMRFGSVHFFFGRWKGRICLEVVELI